MNDFSRTLAALAAAVVMAACGGGGDGVFRMQLPAQQRVHLAVATADLETLELQTGRGAVTVAACLRATA